MIWRPGMRRSGTGTLAASHAGPVGVIHARVVHSPQGGFGLRPRSAFSCSRRGTSHVPVVHARHAGVIRARRIVVGCGPTLCALGGAVVPMCAAGGWGHAFPLRLVERGGALASSCLISSTAGREGRQWKHSNDGEVSGCTHGVNPSPAFLETRLISANTIVPLTTPGEYDRRDSHAPRRTDTFGVESDARRAETAGDQMRRTRGGGLCEATAEVARPSTDAASTGRGSFQAESVGSVRAAAVFSRTTATVTLSVWQQLGLAPVKPFLQQS